MKAGIGQDDHHGGDGGANDGFGEDSLQKMVSRQFDWRSRERPIFLMVRTTFLFHEKLPTAM